MTPFCGSLVQRKAPDCIRQTNTGGYSGAGIQAFVDESPRMARPGNLMSLRVTRDRVEPMRYELCAISRTVTSAAIPRDCPDQPLRSI
jgi:hypothetical protein